MIISFQSHSTLRLFVNFLDWLNTIATLQQSFIKHDYTKLEQKKVFNNYFQLNL